MCSSLGDPEKHKIAYSVDSVRKRMNTLQTAREFKSARQILVLKVKILSGFCLFLFQ
jgi:hypothetical protein